MKHSWEELDVYRGSLFAGEWPTIPELFEISLSQFPERNCFTTFDPNRKTMSYRVVHEHLLRISSYLQEAGLKKGDRVIINGKNSPQWGLAYLGVMFAGGVVVPLDNQMPPERVTTLSCFCDAAFLFGDFDVIQRIPEDESWFRMLKGAFTLKGRSERCPSIMDIQPKSLQEPVRCSCDELAAILFTSGTTGNEKGAMLTHANIVSDVFQACDGIFLKVTEQDVLYALLPLHHSYCCTAVFLEAIKHGAECVFGHGIIVSRMLNDMKQGKVTIFMAIPLLYNKLLAGLMKKVREKGRLAYALIRSLMWVNGILKKTFHINPGRRWFKALLSGLGMDHNRICICGAGPLSPKVFHQYQQLGLDFIQGYGLTETSPILTLNPISRFKIKSVGMCFPLVDMKIDDPDLFGVGEVLVKGPNICQGYYKDDANTQALFTEDGYLKTGDLGSMDKEKYLYLKGRAKNLIVTEGGKNVYPEEIEDMFQLYPQVDQILIRGYMEKKDLKAEGIEAVIYPSEDYYKGKDLNGPEVRKEISQIIHEVNQKLVAYKKISKTTILDKPMAMTSTKKIQRNKVLRTAQAILHI